MKQMSFKVVFDRKNVADIKKVKGLVQIEIYSARKRMYVNTGIKVFKNQWDSNRSLVKNSMLQNEYNKTITSYLKICESYRERCIQMNIECSFEGVRNAIEHKDNGSFISFCRERIDSKILKPGTRLLHHNVISTLEDFGGIKSFTDITYENIVHFDEYLHKQHSKLGTIIIKHKVVKTYIREAIRFDKIIKDPYMKFHIPTGKPSEGKFVRKEDIDKIENTEIPKYLEKARDLMLVQFYTGFAYIDLMNFPYDKITEIDGRKVLIGDRTKTGVNYTIPLFKTVIDILEKYDYNLPKYVSSAYNTKIKEVFAYVGVENAREISSHWLRRGCGYWLLNNGVSMETVSRILAHSSIKMTESIYAKLLPKTIVNDVIDHIENA
jgi:site-specific recombinase XerD